MNRIGALFAVLACLAGSAARADRRVAVVAGHLTGGEGTRPLRYSIADAERIHRILTTVGGVAPEDAALLRNPTPAELFSALDRADARAEGGPVFFYFSGHAKDGALRLGDARIPLADLKEKLSSLSSRVKVAILDSCKSGEFIRQKGGRVGPAFEVRAEPVGPRGLAILTSSAGDEDSQESDLLGASFFTHFLASGLVGDADGDGDGRVTLQEAYGYAYSRTVAETTEARAGLQHPTYAYTLAGAGEVWITDVTKATSTVVFPEKMSGSWVVVDAARRTLVGEFDKQAGAVRRLGLPAGRYEIKRRDGDDALYLRVRLADGDSVTLDESAMQRVVLAQNLAKGADWAGDLATVRPGRWTLAVGLGRQVFFSGTTRNELFPNLPLAGVELESRDRWEASSTVVVGDVAVGSAALAVNVGGLALQTQVSQLIAGVSWIKELDLGPFQPFAGVRASLITVRRTFSDPGFPAQSLLTTAPGVVAGLNWEVTSRLTLGARARASYLLYRSDDDYSLGYADLGVVLKWEL